MQPPRLARALDAALAIARTQGLDAREARVLSDSNKAVLLLLPCEVVARVGPSDQPIASFELDLATRLSTAGAPVVGPDPRVAPVARVRDGFEVSLWERADPAAALDPSMDPAAASAAPYARATEADNGTEAIPNDALLEHCRRLTLALATTWRFDVEDAFPDGAREGEAWLAQLRGANGGMLVAS